MTANLIKNYIKQQLKANAPYLKKYAADQAKSFAAENFPKLVKKTSSLLQQKFGIETSKKKRKKSASKKSVSKQSKQEKRINHKNVQLESDLEKALFSNRSILEDGLRQMGGIRRRRRRGRRRRKQLGGSIYTNESDYFSVNKPLRDLGITDIRYNKLGY